MILDRTGGAEDAVVDEILALAESLEISLYLPHSVKSEIEHPNTPAETKRRAAELIYTEPVTLTHSEKQQHQDIQTLLRGNAQPGQHARDAFHVVEATKYGKYFITNDRRILKHGDEITKGLGIDVVTPTEFLERFKDAERRSPKT
jgi:predicted nucleic acid-binding protein